MSHMDTGIENRIKAELFSRIQGKDFLHFPVMDRRRIIEKIIGDITENFNLSLSGTDLQTMAVKFDEDSFDLGPISLLAKDPEVTEIMINNFDQVFTEKKGNLVQETISFRDSSHIRNIVEKILGPLGLRIDESNPMVDARLPDGSRINVIISPVCSSDIVVTIRKFRNDIKNMDELIEAGSLDRKMADFLYGCVKRKVNVMVCGGTGTGKTTLLNLLSGAVEENERMITVEETLELRFTHKNLVKLEARPPNIEGRGEVTIRDLVRNALRMRPDRLIVGEIRGPEAIDVLQAMNTGHSGSMTTIHANSPGDALTRLETMLLITDNNIDPFTAERIIATSLDMIIQLKKTENGERFIYQVSEIIYESESNRAAGKMLRIKDIAIVRNTAKNQFAEFTGYEPLFLKK